MSIRQAIIPVAGLGTRLLPISLAVPKELLPLGPKPTLQWIAEELAANGLEHLILVTSPEKPEMDRLFRAYPELSQRLLDQGQFETHRQLWANGPYRNCRVSVVVQPQPWGLGDAVARGESLCDSSPFVVALGDCVMGPPGQNTILQRMLTTFHEQNADVVVACEWVPRDRVSRYGIVDPASPGPVFRLRGIVEKPAVDLAPSQWAIAARYIFRRSVVVDLENAEVVAQGREIQLTTAIARSIERGDKVFAVCLETPEQRLDVGNYASYQKACAAFAAGLSHGP